MKLKIAVPSKGRISNPSIDILEKESLYNIIRFNPWNVIKKENLINEFFKQLKGVIYKETNDKAYVAAYVLNFVSQTLIAITENIRTNHPTIPIVYAGGVMSSQYIRAILSKYGMFADAQYSSDNAVGTALLTAELYKRDLLK